MNLKMKSIVLALGLACFSAMAHADFDSFFFSKNTDPSWDLDLLLEAPAKAVAGMQIRLNQNMDFDAMDKDEVSGFRPYIYLGQLQGASPKLESDRCAAVVYAPVKAMKVHLAAGRTLQVYSSNKKPFPYYYAADIQKNVYMTIICGQEIYNGLGGGNTPRDSFFHTNDGEVLAYFNKDSIPYILGSLPLEISGAGVGSVPSL